MPGMPGCGMPCCWAARDRGGTVVRPRSAPGYILRCALACRSARRAAFERGRASPGDQFCRMPGSGPGLMPACAKPSYELRPRCRWGPPCGPPCVWCNDDPRAAPGEALDRLGTEVTPCGPAFRPPPMASRARACGDIAGVLYAWAVPGDGPSGSADRSYVPPARCSGRLYWSGGCWGAAGRSGSFWSHAARASTSETGAMGGTGGGPAGAGAGWYVAAPSKPMG